MSRDKQGRRGTSRDDKGRVGTTRDWTRDAGTRIGIRSHTPSIWTRAKLGERHHTAWEKLGLD